MEIQQHAATVHRRLRRPHSAPFGLLDALTADRAAAQRLSAVFDAPVAPRAEVRRTGITEEVEELFREMQRMPRGRR